MLLPRETPTNCYNMSFLNRAMTNRRRLGRSMGSRIESHTGRRSAAVVTTAATIVFILILVTGCGDTFRPVANPITQPGGDPAGIGNAIILAANGASPGTASHINVSGDTVVAVQSVQTDPRQATLVGGSVVVANFGVLNAAPNPIF